jgi:hypothetical protein
VLTLRAANENEQAGALRGIEHLQRQLREMQAALVHQVPEDIAIAMANLQGCVDWFQVSNGLELSAQRIEAEYFHYDEMEDNETTVREWPPT